MKHVFCLDTNVLRDEKGEFWIKEKEINKLLSYGIVIIPEIVLEEIEQKAIRGFEKEKQTLGSKLKAFFGQQIEKVDIAKKVKDHIESILSREGVNMIKLTNFAVLPELKKLAILKQSPFEGNEGTDKGFKDCYNYFTVLEYQSNNPDIKLFFWTKDKRLQSAYGNTAIQIITGIEDYEKNFGLNAYQKEKIASIFRANMQDVIFIKTEQNINNNQLILTSVSDFLWTIFKYRFEIDNGEIVDYISEDSVVGSGYSVQEVISNFTNSWSFKETHIWWSNLSSIQQYLLKDELIQIFQAIINNYQIYAIIGDDDIFEFVNNLFIKREDILDQEEKDQIRKLLDEYSKDHEPFPELPF